MHLKGYTAKRLTDKFREKSWTKRGVNKLLKKLRDTGTVDRRSVSGRPRSARTEENVETVNDLVLSQEDKLQTHRTVREISREMGIHQSSALKMHLFAFSSTYAEMFQEAACTRPDRRELCCSHEAR